MNRYHVVPSSDIVLNKYKWKVKRGEFNVLQEYKDKNSAIKGALNYADGDRIVLHELDGGVQVIN